MKSSKYVLNIYKHFCVPNPWKKNLLFEYFSRKVFPEINEIFNLMSQYGTVELSGTGSSMYLNFNSSEEAYTIATKVPTNCKFFVTRSLDKSPIYDELNK